MGADEAQIHTPSGVQGVNLIWEDTIAQWVIGDNPTLAKAMLEAGLRVFIYQLCGYTVKVEKVDYTPERPTTYIEALKAWVKSVP